MNFFPAGLEWAQWKLTPGPNVKISPQAWDQFLALQSKDRKNFELLRHSMRSKIPTRDHESRLEFDIIASRIRTALLFKQRQLRELFERHGQLLEQIQFSHQSEAENYFLPLVLQSP